MKRCIIFAAGPTEVTPLLPGSFSPDDYIIAADAGIRNAAALGVKPHLVMGDMDSLEKSEVPEGAVLFPVRKDDTDLMLAVKKGIELGYQTFLIYGALGGRLDHTFASIQTLSYLLDHGCTGVLATIPMCLLVKLFGGKLIYIESCAKVTSPTETGKLLYRFADQFYVQW